MIKSIVSDRRCFEVVAEKCQNWPRETTAFCSREIGEFANLNDACFSLLIKYRVVLLKEH